MKLTVYIHPRRTYLPCTGVGRHINAITLGLNQSDRAELSLLFSQEWVEQSGQLSLQSPLHAIPFTTFPTLENPTERLWKLIGYPSMDSYIPDGTDWLYAPMETYIPVSKCPMAVTIHDVQAFEPNLPWSHTWQHRWFRYKWGRWVRRTLEDCRVVFTVSEFSKQRMVQLLGADPKKLVVVGNGIEPPFFEIANIAPSQLNLSMPLPYVFMVGGLREKKGGDYYLAVADRLRQLKKNIPIVMAGQLDPVYVEAAKACPNIILLGVVSDAELPKLVRGALCLLFLSPYEGFGIPPLEAMAAGVPTIVANRTSLPEVVGDAGIVVEPDATDEIVAWLTALADSTPLRQDYIQRGRCHAAQFTWDRCVERVVQTLITYA